MHVLGGDVADFAFVVDVLEQLLAGQLLAAPDDRRQTPIAQADLVDRPDLPRNRNRTDVPSIPACRSRASSGRTSG